MKRLLLIAVLCLLFVRCGDVSTYVAVYDFEQPVWINGQSVVFDYSTIANKKSGELSLSLRYLPSAIGQNVALTVKTCRSNNLYSVDTLNFRLDGGVGDRIRSAEIVVRRGVIWQDFSAHHTAIMPLGEVRDLVSLSLQIDNALEIAH